VAAWTCEAWRSNNYAISGGHRREGEPLAFIVVQVAAAPCTRESSHLRVACPFGAVPTGHTLPPGAHRARSVTTGEQRSADGRSYASPGCAMYAFLYIFAPTAYNFLKGNYAAPGTQRLC
jgi:hypothetical protein